MIIDLILERKEGAPYADGSFYSEVAEYCELWPEYSYILTAMDEGTEQIVKFSLCRYILENDYNPAICDYINSVNWLYRA